MKPQIGDIWYNRFKKYHYLILQDDVDIGMNSGLQGYRMLILERGILDSAWLEHFNAQCKFVC